MAPEHTHPSIRTLHRLRVRTPALTRCDDCCGRGYRTEALDDEDRHAFRGVEEREVECRACGGEGVVEVR